MADVVEFKLTGFRGVLEMLESLPAEVVSKRGGPVKVALRTGARVLLKEARKNLRLVTSNATKEGDPSTKLLVKNVIASRGKQPTGGNGERYLVRVRRKTYPDRSGKPTTTLKTAQLLEYGSEKQQAEPWLRPAFQAKRQAAVDAIDKALVPAIEKAVAKALQKGKGK